MKRNVIFVIVFLGFFLVVSGLYAQNNVILKQGVYRSNVVSGAGAVYLYGNRNKVTIYKPDGSVGLEGTYRIVGRRVNVDYGVGGFETWTIVDTETFESSDGAIWVWVRARP